ncbi:MAG: secretin and TonB N-terminal domain-containing protein, partial [Planctomycetes bacterium]|nr:secretin and TonB N-terminal domain-containing protein [Planctomycetota bacterium]
CLHAEESTPEEFGTFSLPPKGISKREDKTDVDATYNRIRGIAESKYVSAKMYYDVGKWQQCIDVCDGILAILPRHENARKLKELATSKRLADDTENLDTERTVRDHAALRSVTEEGLMPHRGSDLPRPELKEEEVPFLIKDQIGTDAKTVLAQVLPEINLIETDLNYVLQLLFKTTGVNIIYNPEDIQDKTVTIHARNLTLEDILNYLSRSYKIGYTVNKGTVWVYAADNADSEKALLRPVIIPLNNGLTPLNSPSAGGGGAGAGGNGIRGAAAQAAALTGEGGNGENQGNGNVSEIEDMLSWMEGNWPGWPAETKWRIDKKLNRLILISTPAMIEEVQKIVKMMDVPPIQILVVARFVNVKENVVDQLGFNWTLTPNPDTVPGANDYSDNKVRLANTAANVGVSADALTSGAVAILNNHQLSFALQALEQNSANKVLSAPRVIALNNHTAKIDLNDSIPYQSGVDTETLTTSNDTNSTSSTVLIPQWDTLDIGFKLEVTPSVGSDMKTIMLRVTPEITETNGSVTQSIVVATPGDDGDNAEVASWEQPIVNTQTLSVDAAVLDGQTLVVGGLSRDSITETQKQVPFLSKIPGVGNMFKSKDNARTRSCMLIFVTARIITADNRIYTDNKKQAVRDLAEEDINAGREADVDVINDWLGDPKRTPRTTTEP